LLEMYVEPQDEPGEEIGRIGEWEFEDDEG
jgi:hypothetical protein